MSEYLKEDGGELSYFRRLWSTRASGPVDHSSDIWDQRAERWIGRLSADSSAVARVGGPFGRAIATAEQLRARGLLGEGDTVADVGCGPGLFVMEFAKTAKHVVGIDYSRRFVEYGRERANSLGLDNAEFQQQDFFALEPERENLVGAYDLVFCSLTPAATGKGCLDKLMRMSRGWCCNTTIVHATDSLAERVLADVFGEKPHTRWDGSSFYALFNLLWLSGYYPETFYYDDIRDEVVEPSRQWAKKIAAFAGKKQAEDIARIEEYLERVGEIPRHSTSRYGTILWKVTQKDSR